MPAQSVKVNLLPPSEFELSFWGKFLKWAVTTGRYIIILTELVVILSFLSRFKLDEDLRNLNEQINTQVNYLNEELPKETKFLKLQKKITLTDQMLSSRLNVGSTLDYIENNLTPEVIPMRRLVSIYETGITATTLSEASMGQVISRYSSDPVWKSVELSQLSGDQTYGIRFSMSVRK